MFRSIIRNYSKLELKNLSHDTITELGFKHLATDLSKLSIILRNFDKRINFGKVEPLHDNLILAYKSENAVKGQELETRINSSFEDAKGSMTVDILDYYHEVMMLHELHRKIIE